MKRESLTEGEPVQADLISRLYAEQCASESIHLLGGIQPHGYVTVIDLNSGRICQVSEGITRHYPGVRNAEQILGQPAEDWFSPEKGTLSDVLGSLNSQALLEVGLRRRRRDGAGTDVAWETGMAMECTAYRHGDYAVLEWQPSNLSPESVFAQYQALTEFSQVISDRSDFTDLGQYLKDAALRLQIFSGYDRVMVYRFLPDWSGEIMAEATAAGTAQQFLGQRFPASDIPPQARELYLRNRLRVLADVSAQPDPLVPERLPTGEVLDQSLGFLRSMSQAHMSYLKNMSVQATMTISIIIKGRLWGLLACHHSKPLVPPRHVVQGMRSAGRLLSRTISSRVEELANEELNERSDTLEEALRSLYTDLAADLVGTAALRRHAPTLCEVMRAEALGVLTGGGLRTSFELPNTSKQKLRSWLTTQLRQPLQGDQVSWTCLPDSIQGLEVFPPDTAGVLITRLSAQNDDCMFWLRKELITEVHWAGKPGKFALEESSEGIKLEPRRSFETWKEQQRGQCEIWTSSDKALARLAARRIADMTNELTQQRLKSSLEWSAAHDGLTSLLNRSAMQNDLQKRLRRGAFALYMIDFDNFHKINDTLGHEVGDLLLKELASRLSSELGNEIGIGRVGGDEFLVAEPLASNQDVSLQIERTTKQLKELATRPFQHGSSLLEMDASIGVVLASGPEENARELLKKADIALLEATKRGGGQSAIYSESMEQSLRVRVTTEHELSKAIELDQLVLYYQPQIDLSTRRVVGCEALIRWQHPERGLLMPALFLPIAEANGLIGPIGAWVIDQSARQLAEWNQTLDRELFVAFNASFSQVRDKAIVGCVDQAITTYSANPLNLQIELTESAVMGDEEMCSEVTAALSEIGVSIALDDFGTGYSSLSHIQRLKLDCIKIDRSFVVQLERDQQARAVINSLLALARTLDLTVVAEGVDSITQLQWLTDAGCDIGQGFFWSPAVSAQDFPVVMGKINSEGG